MNTMNDIPINTARPISVTTPVFHEDIKTAEQLIVHNARVSNPDNQFNNNIIGLLAHCLKERHWSIFEQASLGVAVHTTRAIAQQIIRHKSLSVQEFCVSGDTLVKVWYPESKDLKEVPIKDLYVRYNFTYWDRRKGLKAKVFNESTNKFVSCTITEVFSTGEKEVVELLLDNGKSLVATPDHKVLVQGKGFTKIGDISPDDSVGCNSTDTASYSKVVSTSAKGLQDTYDLEVDHESHNYVADGIITHNSQRYAKVDSEELHFPEMRLAGSKNRQSSTIVDDRAATENLVMTAISGAFAAYDELVRQGVSTESARFVLPLSTPTTLYLNGTVRSWIHFLAVRDDVHTQLEHRLIAKSIRSLFNGYFPLIGELLEKIQEDKSGLIDREELILIINQLEGKK